jgi:branched-chain amino acid aminotransferase
MDSLAFVDDAWAWGNPPSVGPCDHALWMASTVFDGIRAFENAVPDVDMHCRRLIRSAEVMGLAPTRTARDIQGLVEEGVKRFRPNADLYIRPMFWASDGWAVPAAESTRFALVLYEAPLPSAQGFAACLSPVRRPLPDTALTTAKAACLYPATARALRLARAAGFDNAVVLDPFGNVAEFATANLFIVSDGRVFTPLPNGTFLDGITKQRVTDLLRRDGITVTESLLRYEDLARADEIFATGNHGKVMPLRRLGNRKLDIGPVTRRARELYWDFALSRCDADSSASDASVAAIVA